MERVESNKWYSEFNDNAVPEHVENEEIQQLKEEARRILDSEIIIHASKAPKSIPHSDYLWIKTVVSKGTTSDKIAAYTLLIQDSPIHNLSYLKNMIGMVKVGKKRECFMAIEALLELFLNDLLPPHRKLFTFSQQPLSCLNNLTSGNVVTRKRRLLLWYFEDQLKQNYRELVVALTEAAHDSVDANKEKVITAMYKLLEGNAEQESSLLSNIVNKLGDPSHKIGSKVIYTLTKLLEAHPNMKEVVMYEVEKVIFRNNISKRAQYYSICFLSQFCLSNDDVLLAKGLISIYFSLFKACIKTGEIDSRMISALLSGVNRAYPFAKEQISSLEEHVNTIYKVIHLSNANVAIHALSLLYLVSDYAHSVTDRFFRVLYKKIAEPGMFNSSHQAMFLSLIFKVLKKDENETRVRAFIKRLLQVSTYLSVPVVCGILYLVSEVVKSKKITLRLDQEAEGDVIKTELDAVIVDDDDDDNEHYEDAQMDISPVPLKDVKVPSIPMMSGIVEKFRTGSHETKANYDPYHRNPIHSGGGETICDELVALAKHFHPTVSLFASNILNGKRIVYQGDPLQDFTLIRFLDKFVFKNPKHIKQDKNSKLTFATFGRKKSYTLPVIRRLRANTKEYVNQNESKIPVDESFLYRYLKEKMERGLELKKEQGEDDGDSVGSNEFEEMMDSLTGSGGKDIDFMTEAAELPKQNKQGRRNDEQRKSFDDDDEEGDEDEEEDNDDDDVDVEDFENISETGSLAEDFEGDETDDFSDGDELEGSDLDTFELTSTLKDLQHPRQRKKFTEGKKDRLSTSKLFAAAEEFSELLEDTDFDAGGSEAMSNKDNAGLKQLNWEKFRIDNKTYNSKKCKRVKMWNHKGKKKRKVK